MYEKDSWVVSALWGRIGAAVLALLAFVFGIFGYSMGAEDVGSANEVITAILTGVAGLLALISKIRETKKVKD